MAPKRKKAVNESSFPASDARGSDDFELHFFGHSSESLFSHTNTAFSQSVFEDKCSQEGLARENKTGKVHERKSKNKRFEKSGFENSTAVDSLEDTEDMPLTTLATIVGNKKYGQQQRTNESRVPVATAPQQQQGTSSVVPQSTSILADASRDDDFLFELDTPLHNEERGNVSYLAQQPILSTERPCASTVVSINSGGRNDWFQPTSTLLSGRANELDLPLYTSDRFYEEFTSTTLPPKMSYPQDTFWVSDEQQRLAPAIPNNDLPVLEQYHADHDVPATQQQQPHRTKYYGSLQELLTESKFPKFLVTEQLQARATKEAKVQSQQRKRERKEKKETEGKEESTNNSNNQKRGHSTPNGFGDGADDFAFDEAPKNSASDSEKDHNSDGSEGDQPDNCSLLYVDAENEQTYENGDEHYDEGVDGEGNDSYVYGHVSAEQFSRSATAYNHAENNRRRPAGLRGHEAITRHYIANVNAYVEEVVVDRFLKAQRSEVMMEREQLVRSSGAHATTEGKGDSTAILSWPQLQRREERDSEVGEVTSRNSVRHPFLMSKLCVTEWFPNFVEECKRALDTSGRTRSVPLQRSTIRLARMDGYDGPVTRNSTVRLSNEHGFVPIPMDEPGRVITSVGAAQRKVQKDDLNEKAASTESGGRERTLDHGVGAGSDALIMLDSQNDSVVMRYIVFDSKGTNTQGERSFEVQNNGEGRDVQETKLSLEALARYEDSLLPDTSLRPFVVASIIYVLRDIHGLEYCSSEVLRIVTKGKACRTREGQVLKALTALRERIGVASSAFTGGVGQWHASERWTESAAMSIDAYTKCSVCGCPPTNVACSSRVTNARNTNDNKAEGGDFDFAMDEAFDSVCLRESIQSANASTTMLTEEVQDNFEFCFAEEQHTGHTKTDPNGCACPVFSPLPVLGGLLDACELLEKAHFVSAVEKLNRSGEANRTQQVVQQYDGVLFAPRHTSRDGKERGGVDVAQPHSTVSEFIIEAKRMALDILRRIERLPDSLMINVGRKERVPAVTFFLDFKPRDLAAFVLFSAMRSLLSCRVEKWRAWVESTTAETLEDAVNPEAALSRLLASLGSLPPRKGKGARASKNGEKKSAAVAKKVARTPFEAILPRDDDLLQRVAALLFFAFRRSVLGAAKLFSKGEGWNFFATFVDQIDYLSAMHLAGESKRVSKTVDAIFTDFLGSEDRRNGEGERPGGPQPVSENVVDYYAVLGGKEDERDEEALAELYGGYSSLSQAATVLAAHHGTCTRYEQTPGVTTKKKVKRPRESEVLGTLANVVLRLDLVSSIEDFEAATARSDNDHANNDNGGAMSSYP